MDYNQIFEINRNCPQGIKHLMESNISINNHHNSSPSLSRKLKIADDTDAATI